jgi:hypothetical protein
MCEASYSDFSGKSMPKYIFMYLGLNQLAGEYRFFLTCMGAPEMKIYQRYHDIKRM